MKWIDGSHHFLRIRIPILTTMILLLITGVAGWLFIKEFETALALQLQHEGSLLADTFNAGIISTADLQDAAMQSRVNNLAIARTEAIEINILLLRNDGKNSVTVASTLADNIGAVSVREHANLLKVLNSSQPVVASVIEPETNAPSRPWPLSLLPVPSLHFLEITAPLQLNGRAVGAIIAKISLADLDRQVNQSRTRLYFIIIIEALSAMLFLGWLLHFTTFRPLQKMITQMNQVAGGNYTQRLWEAKRRDEIGLAAQSFNYMSARLEELQKQLLTYLNPLAAEAAYRRALSNDEKHNPVEMREMSVFFVDVVGFTTISERLGAEGTVAFLNYALERIAAELVRLDGRIDKFVADEVVCSFDGPRHAERAVSAAQAILRVLKESRPDIPAMQVRIGINTGLCIVADIGSKSAGRKDRTILGDVVNIAQRLMVEALPNTAIVSHATLVLIADPPQRLQALGSLKLKGKSTPVTAWLLLADA